MINEQFSLMQLLIASLGSSVFSSALTFMSSKRQSYASADETIRKTYGEMLNDLRGQLDFCNDQIKMAQEREMNHLAIIAQQNGTVNTIQSELMVSQLNIRNLEQQKNKLEAKITNYEDILKRSEAHSKA